MNKRTASVLLGFFALAAAPDLRAQENLLKPLGEAFGAWADGRPEDAAGSLEYVIFRSSDTALTLAAIKELSVILAELGKNEQALAYLTKAEFLAPEDPYIAFEKGWNYLSLEKHLDARTAFENALTLTGEADLASQARFGLALAESELGGPSDAAASLQTLYQKYPYLLSATAEVISEQYRALKKRQHAITFLEEALKYDPRNIQATIDLARMYDTSDYYLQAWQAHNTLSEIDPDEPYFSEKAAKLARYVKGKLDNMMYWTRMGWPVHTKPLDYPDKNRLRIGLFSDSKGTPAILTGFSFMGNTEFSIIDSRLGTVAAGKPSSQWSVRYNELNRIYEVRDSMESSIHSTRNSFRIVPKVKGGVILIKSPELLPKRGVNRGDREVTGELNVIAKEKGFRLVNTTPMEAVIPSMITALAGNGRQAEELKALSVVVRSKLTHLRNARPHSDPDYDICDVSHCLTVPGLQAENELAVSAARATRDEVLSKDGVPVPADIHTACGGSTEEGISDNRRAAARHTPFSLYHSTIKAPPDDLMCLSPDRTTASDVTWTLMLKPKWIESRLNRLGKVGYIRSIVVLKRRPSGRVLTMRVEGTAGSVVLEGFDAISRALAAGMLRSPLFTIRPVFDGKHPGYFLLRGIGTGEGKGYCVLGGHGMAKDMGAKYVDILNRYFPYYKVKKLPQ